MDDKSFNIRVPKKWARVAMIVGVTALIVAPLTAIASHSFTDVPDSNTFHEDIAWLADADVTKGCNPPDNTEFCPDDDVTRGQMAAFMRRFSQYIGAEDGTPAQADNADTVDGMHAEALANNAILVNSADSNVALAEDTTTEVLSLELPPGTYLLSTTGFLNNNAGSPAGVTCELSAGPASVNTSSDIVLGTSPGDRESITLYLLAELDATATASFSCDTNAGWLGNVVRPQILAMSIQTANVTAQIASSTGDDEG